jgi:hypothetical protein
MMLASGKMHIESDLLHTMLRVSSYCCICRMTWVLVLLHMSAYYYICVSCARACSLATLASSRVSPESSHQRHKRARQRALMRARHRAFWRRWHQEHMHSKKPATRVSAYCCMCLHAATYVPSHCHILLHIWVARLLSHQENTHFYDKKSPAAYVQVCGACSLATLASTNCPLLKKDMCVCVYKCIYMQVGRLLSGDPRIKKLSFTGSTAVGKLLMAQCATTVKRVSLGEV